MATTAELCTILLEQFKGWNRDGTRGVLHYLDVAHRMLLCVEAEQRIIYTESTGLLPYLDTTEGDYDYTLNDNVWRLGGVYVEVGVNGSLLDTVSGTDYGLRTNWRGTISYETIAGIDYMRIPYIRSWDKTESGNCRLMFTEDPGDCDDIYQLKQYRWPTEITSDSVQIEVPPPWDEDFLLMATAKLLEGVEHGNYVEARRIVRKEIVPEYWKQLNSGEQGLDLEAEPRGF